MNNIYCHIHHWMYASVTCKVEEPKCGDSQWAPYIIITGHTSYVDKGESVTLYCLYYNAETALKNYCKIVSSPPTRSWLNASLQWRDGQYMIHILSVSLGLCLSILYMSMDRGTLFHLHDIQKDYHAAVLPCLCDVVVSSAWNMSLPPSWLDM